MVTVTGWGVDQNNIWIIFFLPRRSGSARKIFGKHPVLHPKPDTKKKNMKIYFKNSNNRFYIIYLNILLYNYIHAHIIAHYIKQQLFPEKWKKRMMDICLISNKYVERHIDWTILYLLIQKNVFEFWFGCWVVCLGSIGIALKGLIYFCIWFNCIYFFYVYILM